jgi:hypothetical protein
VLGEFNNTRVLKKTPSVNAPFYITISFLYWKYGFFRVFSFAFSGRIRSFAAAAKLSITRSVGM